MKNSELAVLLLAAGYSSRMGAFKPCLKLGNNLVVAQAASTFLDAGIGDVRVVVGHRAGELRQVLAELRLQAISNPDYDLGMFSSVKAGIRTFKTGIKAFFLLPVDIPLVRPHTVKLLTQAWLESKAGIVYPCFMGKRGHPPLITSAYAEEILSYSLNGNLREILSRHEAEALDVETADRGVLMDMDTPDDYQKLQERVEHLDIPDELECQAILRLAGASADIAAHGRAVAELAYELARQCRCDLDFALIKAAGLLHDLAKGKPKHAAAGARYLEEMGFSRVANIVACHMGDGLEIGSEVGEKELVYLTDKLVRGEQLVSLAERFRGSMRRFADEPEILEAVKARWQKADLIKGRVERTLGFSLEKWLEGWRGETDED